MFIKLSRIILIIFFFVNFIKAQDGWINAPSGVTSNLTDVEIINPNTVISVGYNLTILKSTNIGSTWEIKYIDPVGGNFYSVDFANFNTGYCCGAYQQSNPPYTITPKLFKTTNGGNNWYSLNCSFMNIGVKINCLNDSIVLCTDYFNTYISTNSGNSWTNYLSNYSSIFFVNNITGYAISQINLMKTSNTGSNWMIINQLPLNSPLLITFNTMGSGYLLSRQSGSYYISKTTNEGQNWSSNLYPFNCNIQDIFSFGNDVIFICGYNNSTARIHKSTNSGTNWQIPFDLIGGTFNSIDFINEMTGIAVGNSGRIYKTTNGGITSFINTGINFPEKYSLFQNYPNPFNPVTNIRFNIPKKGFTILNIFDAIGRNVSTLINKTLEPGSYSYDWDASNYPSGVYYYKLQAGEYSETKKMVLIK